MPENMKNALNMQRFFMESRKLLIDNA